MANTPPSYNGHEPYIFISYAHRDSARVIPIIEKLQYWGFRVWYDAGIEAGTEWPEYIASHLRDSYAVIAFISEAAIESPHCRQEITYAGAKHKDVLSIYLDNAELPAGLELQLGNNQSMFYRRSDSFDSFIERLIAAELLRPCCSRPNALPRISGRYTPPSTKPKAPPRRKTKSPLPKILLISVLVVAVLAGIIAAVSRCGTGGLFVSPEEKYQQAMAYIASGNYYDAYVILQDLGDFEDSQVQLAKIQEDALIQKIASSKTGETVVWGSYEQNNDTSDGSEPIEWVILHAEDGLVLLISKYGLDCETYHGEEENITWEKCDLRAWLNDEFYYEAFTTAQQSYIFQTALVTEGSADTRDYVFLLDESEAILYSSLIPVLKTTDYAVHNGAKTKESKWWTRSPWNSYGTLEMDYAIAATYDSKDTHMYKVDTTGIAVRPCIWINTRSQEDMETEYNNAVSLFNARQYRRALTAFEKLGNYKDSLEYCARLPKLILMQPYAEAEVGATVTFGAYEFIVLEKQEDRILIVSKYGLGTSDYHKYTMSTAAWAQCSLREWLNDSFLRNDLDVSADERTLILPTTVITAPNSEYGTTGGPETTDYVFILSYEEILQYFPETTDRILYAQNNTTSPVPWWVRTKGEDGYMAVIVDQYGTINLAGNNIFQLSAAEHVRPAMWLNISE